MELPHLMGRWALAAAVLLVGCMTAAEQRLRDACGGDRPRLEDCESGLFWTDCGGTESGPRFACSDSSCRWFVDGCVANGYRPSDCPPGDLCCVEQADGDQTPFAGDVGSGEEMAVTRYVTGWGERVYDRERERALRAVEVVLGEPAVVEGGEAVCSAESSRFTDICTCDGVPPGFRSLRDDGFSVFLMPPCAAILFANLTMDVRLREDGSADAWVCQTGTTDFSGANLCAEATEPVCAEAGTLTFEQWPETERELFAIRMELSVTLDDGRTMELRF